MTKLDQAESVFAAAWSKYVSPLDRSGAPRSRGAVFRGVPFAAPPGRRSAFHRTTTRSGVERVREALAFGMDQLAEAGTTG